MSTAKERIRELWPFVLLLRREGFSWRKIPAAMHERCGLPLVAHTVYLAVSMEHRPRRPR